MTALALDLAHLSERQRQLFDALEGKGWVANGVLCLKVWGEAWRSPDLRLLVLRTRARLSDTPYRIESAPGKGAYRLTERAA